VVNEQMGAHARAFSPGSETMKSSHACKRETNMSWINAIKPGERMLTVLRERDSMSFLSKHREH